MGPSNGPAGGHSGKILVLGKDDRSFLSVVRSLGRKGLEVHVAWHAADSVALASRYVKQAHVLPASDEQGSWKGALFALQEREQFDLILPTNDPAVIALYLHREELPQAARIAVPSERSYTLAFDKLETWKLARQLGIPVPNQIHARSTRDASEIRAAFAYPIVLKPRASFAFGRMKWELAVRKAYSREAFDTYFTALFAKGDVLAQENFVGEGVGIEVLAHAGKILLAFQHVRVHEPPLGGGSSYRKSEPLDPVLFDAARKLIGAMEHTGVAMIEFKRDPRSGVWVMIEINARFWGSLPLSIAAGADFPHALYRMLVHGERTFSGDYKSGIYCRNIGMDFGWNLNNFKADKRDGTLCTRSLTSIALEALHLLTLRERTDEMVIDDPGPGFRACARTLRLGGSIVSVKLRALPFHSGPLRNWQARRLARKLAAARRVLFVCKGNICRSPFAEQYARKVLPSSVEVSSSGYWRDTGRPCPTESVEVARGMGIDLTAHRSQLLSDEAVRAADIVFVFDEENLSVVRELHPAVDGKLHRIGLLSPEGPVNIRDPYGAEFAHYQRSYADIARALGQP